MQGGDAELKGNDTASSSLDDKYCSQGARPKVRSELYNNGFKSVNSKESLSNGSGSARDSRNVGHSQSSASCSWSASFKSPSSLSPSPSSSSSPLSSSSSSARNPSSSSKDGISRARENDRTSSRRVEEESGRRRGGATGNSADSEGSSGNEGDEGLSGDDCCIYTYKGDQFADLPNSFFPANMARNEIGKDNRGNHSNQQQQPGENHGRDRNHRRNSNPGDEEGSNAGSSPEMDYLEMDFDPGPSLELDSEEEIDCYDAKIDEDPVPELPNEKVIETNVSSENGDEAKAGPSKESFTIEKNNRVYDCNSNNYDRTKEILGSCYSGHCSVDERVDGRREDVREEEMESEGDNIHFFISSNLAGERKLDRKNSWTDRREQNTSAVPIGTTEVDSKTPFDGIMLWTEQEAISKQVALATSDVSCGATAVINVMLVLKMRFSVEKVKEGISTRVKTDSSSIPQYLVSRSFAGVAHENLIRGIHHASQGTLYAKFFQMYPGKRNISLTRWLSHWMNRGAVAIATTNITRGQGGESPGADTRHHQMIYGVSSRGVHLTNPVECLQEEEVWNRLTSPSVLHIKRQEIVSRWSPDTNLKPLMCQSDSRWKTMNVLGQVVNILRESPDPSAQGKFLTQHISIPASSGITLVIPRDSRGYDELVSAADLLGSPVKTKSRGDVT